MRTQGIRWAYALTVSICSGGTFGLLWLTTTPSEALASIKRNAFASQVTYQANTQTQNSFYTTAYNLNVRSGPSADARINGSLQLGTRIEKQDSRAGWIRFGYRKWVSSSWLAESDNFEISEHSVYLSEGGSDDVHSIKILVSDSTDNLVIGFLSKENRNKEIGIRGAVVNGKIIAEAFHYPTSERGEIELNLMCIDLTEPTERTCYSDGSRSAPIGYITLNEKYKNQAVYLKRL